MPWTFTPSPWWGRFKAWWTSAKPIEIPTVETLDLSLDPKQRAAELQDLVLGADLRSQKHLVPTVESYLKLDKFLRREGHSTNGDIALSAWIENGIEVEDLDLDQNRFSNNVQKPIETMKIPVPEGFYKMSDLPAVSQEKQEKYAKALDVGVGEYVAFPKDCAPSTDPKSASTPNRVISPPIVFADAPMMYQGGKATFDYSARKPIPPRSALYHPPRVYLTDAEKRAGEIVQFLKGGKLKKGLKKKLKLAEESKNMRRVWFDYDGNMHDVK